MSVLKCKQDMSIPTCSVTIPKLDVISQKLELAVGKDEGELIVKEGEKIPLLKMNYTQEKPKQKDMKRRKQESYSNLTIIL